MKFSETWLREFVNPAISTAALTHQLTTAGLEVDAVLPACPAMNGLVVAEVKCVSKHPHADKLHICQVDCGASDLVSVVCGATNVRAGMRTILAKVGATLPEKSKLEAISLKGVISNGMLCSASEIGLGDDHDDIMELSPYEPIGKPLSEIIDLNDNIIELSLTPNRGDCLSIKGIAREVAVLNNIHFKPPEFELATINTTARRTIKSATVAACPRYLGRIIENVDATVKTPLWLTERLRLSGIRSISIVVDITNFVMLELGQPLHAFDNSLLTGDIEIRFPKEKESIKLLNESEFEIKPGTLLIADESGPLALAGIMGGYNSAVSMRSKNIFLESAFFTPWIILGKARQYGLHTDSSHRFERGVDPQLQSIALERATRLLVQYCGGQVAPVVEVLSEADLPKNKPVILRKTQIKRVLGVELEEQFIKDTFLKLGIESNYDNYQFVTNTPPHRFDINTEVDLIEELARIHGYDAIFVSTPQCKLTMQSPNKEHETIEHLRQILINRDYYEVINYSFIDPDENKLLNNKDKNFILANPIAPELSAMRRCLLPGLLNTLRYNVNRQQERIRIFETGLVFEVCNNLKQVPHIGGLLYGNVDKKQWGKKDILCDFYDIKGDVEALLYAMIAPDRLEMRASQASMLHPGQAVDVLIDGVEVGYFGCLHPKIGAHANNVYIFEFEIKSLIQDRQVKYQAISQYPSVKRDIAIILDETVTLAELIKSIKIDSSTLLSDLQLFDVYRGVGIKKGQKSLALGLTFQATSSTLNDKEIEAIMAKVIDGLYKNFGAKLRE